MSNTEGLEAALISLEQGSRQLGVTLSSDKIERLSRYLEDLAAYNEVTNLVSKSGPQIVVDEHLLDSLTLVKFIEPLIAESAGDSLSLVDIGSGAGFPGLILAIALPSLKVTLVDSIEKKSRFLKRETAKLELSGVDVLTERAEVLGHHPQYREHFNLATARAVGALDLVAELTLPLLKPGGRLLLQKSTAQIDGELERAKRCLPRLNATLIAAESLPELTAKERAVIVIEKTGTTDRQFPRSWKKIKAEPLSQ